MDPAPDAEPGSPPPPAFAPYPGSNTPAPPLWVMPLVAPPYPGPPSAPPPAGSLGHATRRRMLALGGAVIIAGAAGIGASPRNRRTYAKFAKVSTLRGHTAGVNSVAFSPDRRTLATAGSDGTVRLWDISDLAVPIPVSTIAGNSLDWMLDVTFGPDGRTLGIASVLGEAELWDVTDPTDPKPLASLSGRSAGSTTLAAFSTAAPASPGAVNTVIFSPDGKSIATASGIAGGGPVALWDIFNLGSPAQISTLAGTADAMAIAISPDGRSLAAQGQLWNITDLSNPTAVATLAGNPSAAYPALGPSSGNSTYDDPSTFIESVAFSPDGHSIATGSDNFTAGLWSLHDITNPLFVATLSGHTNSVNSVAFSPDGRFLATASNDDTARLWDITTPHAPTTVVVLTGHTQPVNFVAYSPDGNTLATASNDTTVRLWNVT